MNPLDELWHYAPPYEITHKNYLVYEHDDYLDLTTETSNTSVAFLETYMEPIVDARALRLGFLSSDAMCNSEGEYHHHLKVINLGENLRVERAAHVFLHELAHDLQYDHIYGIDDDPFYYRFQEGRQQIEAMAELCAELWMREFLGFSWPRRVLSYIASFGYGKFGNVLHLLLDKETKGVYNDGRELLMTHVGNSLVKGRQELWENSWIESITSMERLSTR